MDERAQKTPVQGPPVVASSDLEGEVDTLVERHRAAAIRKDRVQAELRRRLSERVEARRKSEKLAAEKFPTFLGNLSAVPHEERRGAGFRYVAHGASIRAASNASVQAGVQGRVKAAVIRNAVALTDTQATEFANADEEGRKSVAVAVATNLLRPKGVTRHRRYRRTPPALLCSETPKDPCVEILEGTRALDEPGEEHPETGGTAPAPGESEGNTPPAAAPMVNADVPLLIGKLMQFMSPPEVATIPGITGRPVLGDITESVKGLTLQSGPADSPSFFDFHHLQIAFEPVWHELFDDGVVNSAKGLYTTLVELGLDPNEYVSKTEDLITGAVKLLKYGAKKAASKSGGGSFGPFGSWDFEDLLGDASTFLPSDVPSAVVRAFDITPAQWERLRDDLQNELFEIALELNKGLTTENEPPDRLFGFAPGGIKLEGGVAAHLYDTEQQHRQAWLDWKRERLYHLRRQGQRLISYADPKSDLLKLNQFHGLLENLQARIKEPHRFSVYAATALQRSVNFGLVTTYRQTWVPDGYQAGRLVKTVPMAPKEVRRFTKKVAVRKNRAEKESENNLQVRKTESAVTTRAERDIVEKALKKTNFQMSAEGGVNVGILEIKGSAAFAQEAATESQEAKKEFREAVFKAAEEYKQERTLEVNVSTAEETGLEESGELTNPNDEIPVTYLFYELQRRYKVSERLHGVTPVVLVAQEFPRPDEIDEDWIVAHDWILRRVILDDSFVPAMNYLASKVVGDDVALQEMFFNLQQQRSLVADLKEELLATRGVVGARYAALQQALQQRAAEESSASGPLGIAQGVVGGITGGVTSGIGGLASGFGGGGLL